MSQSPDPESLVASVRHWHQKFEIVPGLITPGSYDPRFLWNKLNMPAHLGGKRAIDIGTSDGFFARELHRCGAEVVCVDYRDKNVQHGFAVMERLYGHELDYRHVNLYDIKPDAYGTFDIVLCLGVLYHLPDMVRALHVLKAITKPNGTIYIESHCDTELPEKVAVARYCKGSSLAGDFTNFWSPNRQCLLDMLFDAGLEVSYVDTWGSRILAIATLGQNITGTRAQKIGVAYGVIG